jgi:hypothetical protein
MDFSLSSFILFSTEQPQRFFLNCKSHHITSLFKILHWFPITLRKQSEFLPVTEEASAYLSGSISLPLSTFLILHPSSYNHLNMNNPNSFVP